MSFVATLRYMGVSIKTGPGGGLVLTGLPPELRDEARRHKAKILTVIESEKWDGVRYLDSAFYVQLDLFYRELCEVAGHEQEVSRLKEIASLLDDKALEDIEDAYALRDSLSSEALGLVDRIRGVLSGRPLYGVACEVMSPAVVPSDLAVSPCPSSGAVNMAAFA